MTARRRPRVILPPAQSPIPEHMLAPVMAADGTMLRGSRAAVVNGVVRRTCNILESIRVRGETRQAKGGLPALTDAHAKAAAILRADWTDTGGGIGPSAVNLDAVRGGDGGRIGPAHAMLRQLAIRVRYEAALTHVGALMDVLAAVVLMDVPVSRWARDYEAREQRAMTEGMAMGRLIGALDRLVEFYDSAREIAS